MSDEPPDYSAMLSTTRAGPDPVAYRAYLEALDAERADLVAWARRPRRSDWLVHEADKPR